MPIQKGLQKISVVLHERLISTVLYLTPFLGSLVSFLFTLAQALHCLLNSCSHETALQWPIVYGLRVINVTEVGGDIRLRVRTDYRLQWILLDLTVGMSCKSFMNLEVLVHVFSWSIPACVGRILGRFFAWLECSLCGEDPGTSHCITGSVACVGRILGPLIA